MRFSFFTQESDRADASRRAYLAGIDVGLAAQEALRIIRGRFPSQ